MAKPEDTPGKGKDDAPGQNKPEPKISEAEAEQREIADEAAKRQAEIDKG